MSEKQATLKNGRIAVLAVEPIGLHIANASVIANNKQQFIAAAIAAQVVLIRDEDKSIELTMEDVLQMPAKDYLSVVTLAMGEEGNDLLPPSK